MIGKKQLQQGWHTRRVLIIGAARQGLALAGYLARCGAQVILNDQRPESELAEVKANFLESSPQDSRAALDAIQWVTGGHPLAILDGIDLVCVSGGVPLSNPLVVQAQRSGIELTNDSQIFMEIVPCIVVGITGSAGKTTTTTLVGRIARLSGLYPQVWVGGNIGNPLISSVEEMSSEDLVVMELSSFQLELMSSSPHVAAILNVTPNHLDRHGTMDAYLTAKARILDFQSSADVAILGRDDPGAVSLSGHVQGKLFTFGISAMGEGQEGSFYRDGGLFLHLAGQNDTRLMERSEIRLRGEHNLMNVLAASTICAAVEVPPQAMKVGVVDFEGVSHRLEYVRTWGGADWYNDSIATAPERSMAAIRSFEEPLVLLAGGRDKNLPWNDFARLAYRRVDHLVLFGEASTKIMDALDQAAFELERQPGSRSIRQRMTVTSCQNLKEAVLQAARIVKPGDVVLLSPGGTSFDEFRDFEERGVCFTRWVKELP